jgi:hypothetical protein
MDMDMSTNMDMDLDMDTDKYMYMYMCMSMAPCCVELSDSLAVEQMSGYLTIWQEEQIFRLPDNVAGGADFPAT